MIFDDFCRFCTVWFSHADYILINAILHVTGVLVETWSLSIRNCVSKAKSHDQKWPVSSSFETIRNHWSFFDLEEMVQQNKSHVAMAVRF